MKLYFLRHGKADWPDWNKPDDERPLTQKGRKEVRKVARLLKELEVAPFILTSSLPRAQQTAAIAAKVLEAKICEEEALRPGFDAARLAPLLNAFPEESLMLVGHEPDFTSTIFELTGARTKLSKAGVALVDLDTTTMSGRLLWLLPPRIAFV